jgi:two-component system, sensor histidine kinase and response regulator
MKVLIAEDDAVSRRLLEAMLEKEGYEVETAADGIDAWDKLQKPNAAKLLVLDWMMPGMDGAQICRKLRETARDQYVYVIMLTAKSLKQDLLEGMAAGVDDYLVKPCDLQELRARLRVGARLVHLQEELLKRSQVIQDLVYALSHDLRTPLVAMGVVMNQAMTGVFGEVSDEYRRVLGNAKQSNEELLRLAETLLMVARFENDKAGHTRDEVDVCRLVQQCTSELEPLWKGKPVLVEAHLPNEPCRILGDRQELRRLIINLLDNSIKYTPANGKIDIIVETEGEDIRVDIADNGYGMPEETCKELFSAFWRNSSSSRHGAGTGLGLHLCKRIVEAHGGQIQYRPNKDQGSVFTFTLPTRVNMAAANGVIQ